MVERERHGELREILDEYTSDFLLELCYILRVPRSGPKYKKINEIIRSEYDYEYVKNRLNFLAFGFMLIDYYSSTELSDIIEEYDLHKQRSKSNKMVEIIASEEVSPRDLLGPLETDHLEHLFFELFEEEPTLSREVIIKNIIEYYELQWLEGTKGSGFIIMPISDDPDLESVYHIIKNECQQFDIKATRIDEIQSSDMITKEIIHELKESDYLIVDLSNERPNVYYELGYAHGYGKNLKKIVLMAKKGTKLHFDIRNMRTIIYRNPKHLRMELRKRLKSIVSSWKKAAGSSVQMTSPPS
jgi:hypothetical protein